MYSPTALLASASRSRSGVREERGPPHGGAFSQDEPSVRCPQGKQTPSTVMLDTTLSSPSLCSLLFPPPLPHTHEVESMLHHQAVPPL